jgi:hypothetical protein
LAIVARRAVGIRPSRLGVHDRSGYGQRAGIDQLFAVAKDPHPSAYPPRFLEASSQPKPPPRAGLSLHWNIRVQPARATAQAFLKGGSAEMRPEPCIMCRGLVLWLHGEAVAWAIVEHQLSHEDLEHEARMGRGRRSQPAGVFRGSQQGPEGPRASVPSMSELAALVRSSLRCREPEGNHMGLVWRVLSS